MFDVNVDKELPQDFVLLGKQQNQISLLEITAQNNTAS
jgi:hypothetical protein